MRLIFAPISPACRPLAAAKPEPPAAASAGTSNRKLHGMAILTAAIATWEANISLRTVDSQRLAIVSIATVPATG